MIWRLLPLHALFAALIVASLIGCERSTRSRHEAESDKDTPARDAVTVADETPEALDRLVLPGILTIATVAEGHEWREVRYEEINGVPLRVLSCEGEDGTPVATLVIQHRSAPTQSHRSAAVKGTWNGAVDVLREQGFSGLRGPRPSVDRPIPDRVEFSIEGQQPDGQPVHYRSAVVFGANIYQFSVMATTLEEAERYFGALDTLEELGE
jgi:hypothetical protein